MGLPCTSPLVGEGDRRALARWWWGILLNGPLRQRHQPCGLSAATSPASQGRRS